jgi:hypothetical protein
LRRVLASFDGRQCRREIRAWRRDASYGIYLDFWHHGVRCRGPESEKSTGDYRAYRSLQFFGRHLFDSFDATPAAARIAAQRGLRSFGGNGSAGVEIIVC